MEILKIEIKNENKILSKLEENIKNLGGNYDYNPIWQSIAWNLMLQKTGYIKKWFFIWIYEKNELKNYILIEKRSIWAGFYALFVLWWPANNYKINKLKDELVNLWKEENVIYSQIEPLENDIIFEWFKDIKLKNFIEKCTVLIDLEKSDQEILALMKQKWRYNIKIAEKNDIKIEKVLNNEQNLNIFYNLLKETNSRDNFNINSLSYFKNFLDYLYENWLWWLYFAKKWGKVIVAWIFVFYGKTTYYYYGASTSDNNFRKYMATYLLQWEMILEAKKRWCKIYDFLWVACEDDKKSHLTWVSDFKLKLSQNLKKWPKSQIYINKKAIFILFYFKNFFKKFLK